MHGFKNKVVDCLRSIDNYWFEVRAMMRKRRNSYKLYQFYKIQVGLSLACFVFGVVIYATTWSSVKPNSSSFAKECFPTGRPAGTSYNSELAARGGPAICDNDIKWAACEYKDQKALIDFVLVSAIFWLAQMVFSIMIAWALSRFMNLPAEKLQNGKTTRCLLYQGGVAKQGPWLTRFCHMFQGIFLGIEFLMLASNTCKGELSKTKACALYSQYCGYNKLKNCLYFYNYCYPSMSESDANSEIVAGKLHRCLSEDVDDYDEGEPSDRTKFTGLMDIRLLTSDPCRRCQVLQADLAGASNLEFWLMDEGASEWDCALNVSDPTAAVTCDCSTALAAEGCTLTDKRGACTASYPGTVFTPEEETPGDLCAWSLDNPVYWTTTGACYSNLSDIHKQCQIFMYVALSAFVVLTVIGQALRITAKAEPFLFNPQSDTEWMIFRLLRWMAP